MADARNDLDSLAHTSRDLHAALRRDAPLVQCLTNFVSMNYAANVLAAGASPAMVHAAEEAPEFSRISGAVVINIGTLSQPWLDSMLLTAQAASQASVPWVLDPVAHHATAFRRDAVRRLLALKPAIIRGNASEIIALAAPAPDAAWMRAIRWRRPSNRRASWHWRRRPWWPSPAKWTMSPTDTAPCASPAATR